MTDQNTPPFDYTLAWGKVDCLDNQGLYKSAVKEVNTIFEAARREENSPQKIKALMYRGKYSTSLEEDNLIRFEQLLLGELERASFPENALLQSILAEFYDRYLKANLYKIRSQTTTDDTTITDMRKWSARRFIERSNALYLASLRHAGLEAIPYTDYALILTEAVNTDSMCDNLYEILAYRALNHFKSDRTVLPRTKAYKPMDQPAFFDTPERFVDMKWTVDDAGGDLRYHTLGLFRDLERHNLEAGDIEELLYVALERLEWVRSQYVRPDKNARYEQGLDALIQQYPDATYIGEALYRKALLWSQAARDVESNANRLRLARDLCLRVEQGYEGTVGAAHCQALRLSMEREEYQVNIEEVALPDEPLLMHVSYTNVGKLYFKVLPLPSGQDVRHLDLEGDVMEAFYRASGLHEWKVDLPDKGDLREHSVEASVPPMQSGSYVLISSSHPIEIGDARDCKLHVFQVSSLAYFRHHDKSGKYIIIVDRSTGKPVSGADVVLYYDTDTDHKRGEHHTVSDADGIVRLDPSLHQVSKMSISKGEDRLIWNDHIYNLDPYHERNGASVGRVLFFADRSLYRPGQTLHYKGICIGAGRIPHLDRRCSTLKVQLVDPHNKVVAEREHHPNEFGSVNGSFVLPEGGLSGRFYLRAVGVAGRLSLRVEEYKRPTFEVDIRPYEGGYQLGDTIEMQGEAKAYTGFPIAGAEGRYVVRRKVTVPYFYRHPLVGIPRSSVEMEIAHGPLKTDEKGQFVIPIELFAEDIDLSHHSFIFHYELSVDIIDRTGETHSAKRSIYAGNSKVIVEMNVTRHVKEGTAVPVVIESHSSSRQPLRSRGVVEVYRQHSPERNFRKRYWDMPDTFLYDRRQFHTLFPQYAYGDEADRASWKTLEKVKAIHFDVMGKDQLEVNLPPGEYKFVMEMGEDSGGKIRLEKYVSVYSSAENPYGQLLIATADRPQYVPKDKAHLHMQTQITLHVYSALWRSEKSEMEARWIQPTPQFFRKLMIEESDRGGAVWTYSYIHDNRFYTGSVYLEVPWHNKELKYEMVRWQKKLKPGAPVEWEIRIKRNDGQRFDGEVLASMYDQSLDAIYPSTWDSVIRFPTVGCRLDEGVGFGKSRPYQWGNVRDVPSPVSYPMLFRFIDWFGFNVYGRRYRMRSATDAVLSSAMPLSKGNKHSAGLKVEHDQIAEGTSPALTADKPVPQPLRTNLKETVFFYPDIRAKEDGSIALSFKMNDALTRWKLRLFAHDQSLCYGYLEQSVITEREVMITPNVPRFVRERDRLYLQARIDNMKDIPLTGTARIELLDATTMRDVTEAYISQPRISFEAPAQGSSGVGWTMDVPEGRTPLLVYRVYAESGDFADAQEGYLPVLTHKKLVVETLPFWVSGDASKHYVFRHLQQSAEKDLQHVGLTVEATSNPLWMALQTLSHVKSDDSNNALCQAQALFVNCFGAYILEANPNIQKVYEVWKSSDVPLNRETLLSNLRRNPTLKQVVLEETPWLLDAEGEEAQRRNLELLMDVNRLVSDRTKNTALLRKLQNGDGGFPWFKGGRSNPYITRNILEILGRVRQLGQADFDAALDKLLKRALQYTGAHLQKTYTALLHRVKEGKAQMEDNHLSPFHIHYLYLLGFYPDNWTTGVDGQALQYYRGQCEKYWKDQPLYLQGMMALILYRLGDEKEAQNILRAAEEQSITSEELGMYWKHYHGYHWYQYPIETQSLMIEAYAQILPDTSILNALKVWLLKQKQTHIWKTNKATLSAVFALLDGGGDAGHTSALVRVIVGDQEVTPASGTRDIQAGTGYYRHTWAASEVEPKQGEIKVINPNKGIAWGGIYWQYLQDLDQIEGTQETALKLERTVYLVRSTDQGERMSKVRENTPLHAGDLVRIKISIEVDRPMEFVHLSDQRAACLEPLDPLSHYMWRGGVGFYRSPKDSKVHFFIDNLPRGLHVIEYDLRVMQRGRFSNGIAELQSYYAPEFSSHSSGLKLTVE